MKTLTLTILALFCMFGCTEVNQTESLIAKVDSLKSKNDSLTLLLTEKVPETNNWYEDQYDGHALISKGIQNPSEYIETQFREQTGLIPIEAILGGTMAFGRIQLLRSEWIIADFSDGHIQGSAIYRYRLNKKGQLEFKLISSIGPE
jgi:hypothetical protein